MSAVAVGALKVTLKLCPVSIPPGFEATEQTLESGIWLGGEAAYARRWTGFDSPGIETETTNGWTLTALAGRRLTEGFGTYVAAGVNKYGGSGPYARVGFELSP